jgi:putative methylase
MGKPAQNRLIRKLDLERFLGQIPPNPSPKANLEQYTTSPSVAASMLHLAAYTNGDVVGKRVLDLGCGTGRLGLAAAFLGAESVVGVDLDKAAVAIAQDCTKAIGLTERAAWVAGDIDAVDGAFDTVIQNPPFGVQKRSADRRFLQKALQVGNSVYSLHNHPGFDKQLMGRLRAGSGQLIQVEPDAFLKRLIEGCGGKVEEVYALSLVIPKMFEFHMKAKQEIVIDLYVIKRFVP